MNTLNENKPKTIDYNDLKKRRMLRSNARRTKINSSSNHHHHNNNKIQKYHQIINQLSLPHCTYQPRKISNDNRSLLLKLPSVTKTQKHSPGSIHHKLPPNQSTSNTKQQLIRIIQSLQNTNTSSTNQNPPPSHSSHQKIQPTPPQKSLNITTKLQQNPTILKQLLLHQIQNTLFQKSNNQQTIKYLTDNLISTIHLQKQSKIFHMFQPQQQKQNNNDKQNTLFNTISPIQQKTQKMALQPIQQVSGFSILMGIQQIKQQSKKQQCIASVHNQQFILNKQLSKQSGSKLCSLYPKRKMPKIAKKCLPKDFFLRV